MISHLCQGIKSTEKIIQHGDHFLWGNCPGNVCKAYNVGKEESAVGVYFSRGLLSICQHIGNSLFLVN